MSTPGTGVVLEDLSTGVIAALRADAIRRGLAGEMDDVPQPIAYEPPLPLPPQGHRLNISPTLQLISCPDDSYSVTNPRLTVSDGIHTATAMLRTGTGQPEPWAVRHRPDRLRPFDCFVATCCCAGLIRGAADDYSFVLHLFSHPPDPSCVRPLRWALPIGEPTPAPSIYFGPHPPPPHDPPPPDP